MNLIQFYEKKKQTEAESHVYGKAPSKQVYVYVLKSELNGSIKIGITDNINKRKKQLETGAGFRTNLIVAIEVLYLRDPSAKFIEKTLHEFFACKRTVGEWFNLSCYDIARIKILFWHIYGEEVFDYLLK